MWYLFRVIFPDFLCPRRKRFKRLQKVNFIYQSLLVGKKKFLRLCSHVKIAVHVWFFLVTNGKGCASSESLRRFRKLTDTASSFMYILTHIHTYIRTHVISPVVSEHPLVRKSCRRRNLLGRLGELFSPVSPADSRTSDVFPAHDRKYFLFVRVHGTSSIRLPLKSRCRRIRFPPGTRRVWRDSEGLWELKTNNIR